MDAPDEPLEDADEALEDADSVDPVVFEEWAWELDAAAEAFR